MTVIDLDRERRLCALDAELVNETNHNPALADRFSALARGELPEPLEYTMPPNEPLMLRLPQTLLDRADELVPVVETSELGIALGRVTRSAVIRLAIARGLADLERELAPKPAPKKRRSK